MLELQGVSVAYGQHVALRDVALTVAAGEVVVMLGANGVVNDILMRFGLPRIIWFNSPEWSFTAICLAIIWKTSSFVGLILLAGLQTIPRSLYEAADVDGAGRLRQFFEITLPLLKPAIVVALIIPYTMTRGGPGTSTATLAMYIHQNTVSFLDLGYGSALAVAMFVLSMGVTVIYLRMMGKGH